MALKEAIQKNGQRHLCEIGSYFSDNPILKRPLRGPRFDTIKEIQAESKKALKAIPEKGFNKCFSDWKKRCHKCIISGGDHFEGDEIDFDK